MARAKKTVETPETPETAEQEAVCPGCADLAAKLAETEAMTLKLSSEAGVKSHLELVQVERDQARHEANEARKQLGEISNMFEALKIELQNARSQNGNYVA